MKPNDNQVVRFRALRLADAEVLYAGAFGVAEVARFLQWGKHASAEQTRAMIEEMIGLHEARRKFFWVACCAVDGRVVGMGSIKPEGGTVWLGFVVVLGEQRKGFGLAILSALEEAGLRKYGSVSAAVEPGNGASIGLLRRASWVARNNAEVEPLLAYEKHGAGCPTLEN